MVHVWKLACFPVPCGSHTKSDHQAGTKSLYSLSNTTSSQCTILKCRKHSSFYNTIFLLTSQLTLGTQAHQETSQ